MSRNLQDVLSFYFTTKPYQEHQCVYHVMQEITQITGTMTTCFVCSKSFINFIFITYLKNAEIKK